MDTQTTDPGSLSKDNLPLEALHVERVDDQGSPKGEPELIIAQHTAFAGFSRLEAIKRFWWPSLICLVSTIGCLNDGYQNQLPGNDLSLSYGKTSGLQVLTFLLLDRQPGQQPRVHQSVWQSPRRRWLPFDRRFLDLDMGCDDARGANSLYTCFRFHQRQVWSERCYVPFQHSLHSCECRYIYLYHKFKLIDMDFPQGTAAETTAKTPGQWAAAKFIFGLAQGITTSTIPVVSSNAINFPSNKANKDTVYRRDRTPSD